jgi:hypothetical protein
MPCFVHSPASECGQDALADEIVHYRTATLAQTRADHELERAGHLQRSHRCIQKDIQKRGVGSLLQGVDPIGNENLPQFGPVLRNIRI